jgi:Putative adhesin
MKRSVIYATISLIAMAICTAVANGADLPGASEKQCSADHFRVNDLVSYAESRDQHLANGSTNYINPGENGSVRVHGWNNQDVLVRACIQTAAPTEADARTLASEVAIARGAGMIEPTGPARTERNYWGVSYEIWVPNSSSLDIKANNGSIGVDTVQGEIHFQTANGSVHLSEVGGNVNGSTTNGSLTIDFGPNGWTGTGLRAETTNGSVRLNVPENFSAQVDASTVNGKVKVDFPVTVSGQIDQSISVQLGKGGPLIEAKTVNGSVHIARKS